MSGNDTVSLQNSIEQEEGELEGPMGIVDFWSERQANLENLQGQLDSQAVQNTTEFLEAHKSSYHAAFHRSK